MVIEMKKLPSYCLKALKKLKEHGFEAYAVGGCVRDSIMNLTVHDVDITTSATSEEIENTFPHSVRTGGKYFTVTVFVDGNPIEITPFRKEGDYTDARRPDSIEVASTLAEDISRRDFTVNSICFDGEKIIDLLNGENDIKEKIIRCIGSPDLRFQEDALRIMRAFRFSAGLGFQIEENTFRAALDSAWLLKKISLERIFEELIKILLTDTPEILLPLFQTGAFEFISLKPFNELEMLKTLAKTKESRLAGFLEFSGRPSLSSLPISKALKRYITNVFFVVDNFPAERKSEIKQLLKLVEPAEFLTAYDIRRIKGIPESAHRSLLEEIVKNREPYRIAHLAISGGDLFQRGLRGAAIKEALNMMLDTVIISPELNTKTQLLNMI